MKQILLVFSVLLSNIAVSQKPVVIGDFTVNYAVSSTTGKASPKTTSKILYVKGNVARADFISDDYKQTILYDNKTGDAIVLKELGAGKYMTKLSSSQWKAENKRYEGMTISLTEEKQTIIGYECKKAIMNLKDGTSYTLFYATSIIPSTTENPFQFKDIPGLVLELETSSDSKSYKITYTASFVNLNPVPASKFELPSSGFRILQ